MVLLNTANPSGAPLIIQYIIVGILLICSLAWIILRFKKRKKGSKFGCGCGEDCAFKEACNKNEIKIK